MCPLLLKVAPCNGLRAKTGDTASPVGTTSSPHIHYIVHLAWASQSQQNLTKKDHNTLFMTCYMRRVLPQYSRLSGPKKHTMMRYHRTPLIRQRYGCGSHVILNAQVWSAEEVSFQYTPLAVIICLLLWKLYSEIFHKKQKFPKFSKMFQNFKIFSQNFHWLRVYNIKHNLERSGFQFWMAARVTKFQEK